jgi:hypothetical protein
VAVRRAHHSDLDALIAETGNTSGPFSFDCGPPLELEAELAKEINRPFKVMDDSYVIEPFQRHVSNLQAGVRVRSAVIHSFGQSILREIPACEVFLATGEKCSAGLSPFGR